MSWNLTVVREMLKARGNVTEVSGKKILSGNLYRPIANFMFGGYTGRVVNIAVIDILNAILFTSPPGGVRTIVIFVSACLSVGRSVAPVS